MAYPSIKTKSGPVLLTPDLIREIGRELPKHYKDMSLAEMIELGKAVRDLTAASGLASVLKTVKGFIGG